MDKHKKSTAVSEAVKTANAQQHYCCLEFVVK